MMVRSLPTECRKPAAGLAGTGGSAARSCASSLLAALSLVCRAPSASAMGAATSDGNGGGHGRARAPRRRPVFQRRLSIERLVELAVELQLELAQQQQQELGRRVFRCRRLRRAHRVSALHRGRRIRLLRRAHRPLRGLADSQEARDRAELAGRGRTRSAAAHAAAPQARRACARKIRTSPSSSSRTFSTRSTRKLTPCAAEARSSACRPI